MVQTAKSEYFNEKALNFSARFVILWLSKNWFNQIDIARGVFDMVMLYIDFRIPWLVSRFAIRGPDGRADTAKAARLFSPESRRAIAEFPGLKWKVWALSEDGREGYGYYLFDSRADAEARAKYAKKYYPRDGLYRVRCTVSEVLEGPSRDTRAPLDTPANPPMTQEKYDELCREHRGVDLAAMLFKK